MDKQLDTEDNAATQGVTVDAEVNPDEHLEKSFSQRDRNWTEKGLQYQLDLKFKRRQQAYNKLKVKTDYINGILQLGTAKNKEVQLMYNHWGTLYEIFLDLNEEYNQIRNSEENDDWFQECVAEMKQFKNFIEEWFVQNPQRSSGSLKSVSTRSSKSSKVSSRKSELSSIISSVRLREQQNKAELQVKAAVLAKKRELEEAKLRLRLNEEELKITEQLAISEARLKQIEDEYPTKDINEINSHLKNTGLDNGQCVELPLNADATELSTNVKKTQIDKDSLKAVVAQMKKPVLDVQKFSGDPLQFQRFIKQFRSRVEDICDDPTERLNFLEQYTEGEPRDIIQSFIYMEPGQGYKAALKEMYSRYGDQDIIVRAFINKALNWSLMKTSKDLDEFAIFLKGCLNAVSELDSIEILDYSENLKKIIAKLPVSLFDKWRTKAYKIKDHNRKVKFVDVVEFVEYEARKANDPMFGRNALTPQLKHQQKHSFATSILTNNTESTTQIQDTLHNTDRRKAYIAPCIHCHGLHPLELCPVIKQMPFEERLRVLRSIGLCFGCLVFGHRNKDCRRRVNCSTCGGRHPFILHKEVSTTPVTQVTPQRESGVNHDRVEIIASGTDFDMYAEKLDVTMAVIPVKVHLQDRPTIIETYAFLDPGSNASFLTTSLMRQLGCEGDKRKLTMETMGSIQTISTYAVRGLQVSDMKLKNTIDMPLSFSKDSVPVKKRHIPTTEDLKAWTHLADITLPSIKGTEIGLVIGNNVADAYTPLEVRTGPRGTPHMTKSRLGWIPWGITRGGATLSDIAVNRIDVLAVKKIEEDKNLEVLYRRSLSLDFTERSIDDKAEYSKEDKKFIQMLEKSKSFKEGHYEFGLPFKGTPVFPDNRVMAMRRLEGLRKKFNGNPGFLKEYSEFMTELERKGYSERLQTDDVRSDGKQWFVPHHAVYHPTKKTIRVVFDCSAQYQGVILNERLMSGPDLINSLIGVLMRFRQEKVAISGDVEKMFYQVRVAEDDRDCLRYYWWPNGDLNQAPSVYRMTVHLFGAVSSPSCANYALKNTVKDNEERYAEQICSAASRNFYVDDFLHSVKTEEEALNVINEVTDLCKKGGFRITKWNSNRKVVWERIKKSERTERGNRCCKALGMTWSTDTDEFHFIVSPKLTTNLTRRKILSEVSGLFDPLGLISPFILPAKVLLQQLCRDGFEWDQNVSEVHQKKWMKWLKGLNERTFKVERCYIPAEFEEVTSVELHLFSDASEIGYGAAAYVRLEDDQGKFSCSLVCAKSRVAPLKRITIPRMELTAATLAVRLSHQIQRDMDYTFRKIRYWTDSMAVIRYISNDTSRFQTFVANRLAVIQDGSCKEEWCYIKSDENPADCASRGIMPLNSKQTEFWFKGPEFLRRAESQWPKEASTDIVIPEEDPELKKQVNTVLATPEEPSIIDTIVSRSSTWVRVKRVVAWVLLAVRRFATVRKSNTRDVHTEKTVHEKKRKLTLSDVEKELPLPEAEKTILKSVQASYFQTEVQDLRSNGRVKMSSQLSRLDPYIEDDLIRVGGRLDRAAIPYECKHQVLLPKKSRLSMLLLEHCHRKIGHLGKNATITKLREKHWIIGAGQLAKAMSAKCLICRKYQGKRIEQKMGELPDCRLIPDESPFTRVGMDFFGPFEVKRGRVTVKRHVLLFTCLSIRAVHLEVVFSLDTDSCINAIRRFISRRGPVKLFLSDNGTNFRAAEKELRKEDVFQEIKWHFNPPSGSHFGGVWERLIRSVRKVMFSLQKEHAFSLDDEGLQTLVCEVEAVLNGRPITTVSEDHQDLEPLTPNHLLLMSSGEQPTGTFDSRESYARRRWRRIQYLADRFWGRWLKEYLPMLQRRQKWLRPKRNVAVNDIVMIVENTPRNSWCLGKVTETFPDKHGLVRRVMVKTRNVTIQRPVDKLILLLEADTPDDSQSREDSSGNSPSGSQSAALK